jgi:hypothetical protein
MDADARRRAEEGTTWPEHDCHEVLHQHFHNQDDAQWTTCGTCGRIVAFRWKNEADAVAQEHQRLREAVEIAMAKAYDNPSEYRRLIRAVFNGR